MGRYLTAQNNRESRLGLLMNGLVKIPMQFAILLIGVLVFAFYQFNASPITFNENLRAEVAATPYADSLSQLEARFVQVSVEKKQLNQQYVAGRNADWPFDKAALETRMRSLGQSEDSCRKAFGLLATKAVKKKDSSADYVFLGFIKNHLPDGLKGLLIAIVFLAAWGSIAAALNSLAASTVVDFHCRLRGDSATPQGAYKTAQAYTLAWGLFSIVVAEFAHNLGQSLIETVNVLGSLFYGVILGIFLVAFYLKQVKGAAVFVAALLVEIFVVLLFFNAHFPFLSWMPDLSFLWLNAVGAIGVMLLSVLLQQFVFAAEKK